MSPSKQTMFLHYIGVVIGWILITPIIVLALMIAISFLLGIILVLTAPIWVLIVIFNLMGVA